MACAYAAIASETPVDALAPVATVVAGAAAGATSGGAATVVGVAAGCVSVTRCVAIGGGGPAMVVRAAALVFTAGVGDCAS